jgi:hypothetical protein
MSNGVIAFIDKHTHMPSKSYTNPPDMSLAPPVKLISHRTTNVVEQPYHLLIVGQTVYIYQAKMPLDQVDGVSSPCWAETITSSSSTVIEYSLSHPNHALVAPTISNLVSWKTRMSPSLFLFTPIIKQYATYKSSLRVTNKMDI